MVSVSISCNMCGRKFEVDVKETPEEAARRLNMTEVCLKNLSSGYEESFYICNSCFIRVSYGEKACCVSD